MTIDQSKASIYYHLADGDDGPALQRMELRGHHNLGAALGLRQLLTALPSCPVPH